MGALLSSQASHYPDSTVGSIIKDYLIKQGYQARSRTLNAKLRDALVEKVILSEIPYDVSDLYTDKRTTLAIGFGQMEYPYNSFELQLHVAMYTWLVSLIDDKISHLESDINEFSRRFHGGLNQKSALLNSFADNLRGMYIFYDPIIASTIIQSSLGFIDTCLLEVRREYQTMPQNAGGERWLQYFRAKNGVADGYVLFAFPQELFPDVSSYLQIIPDLGDFIVLCNDVMSFYKEELAGETQNYVHLRAKYENKSPLCVLQDMSNEIVEACARVSRVVEGKGKIEEVVKELIQGYCALHTSGPRYRLDEIGLGENVPFV